MPAIHANPTDSEMTSAWQRLRINAAWLIHLRLAAVIGQFLTIAAVSTLGIQLPLLPLSLILGTTAVTNGLLVAWERNRNRLNDWESWAPHGDTLLAAIMLLDLLSLTGLLFFTGGTANPFVVFYFVNVALAAVLSSAKWAWRIVGVGIVCLIFLGSFHVRLPILEPEAVDNPVPVDRVLWLSCIGLWVSYGTCAAVIVNFITRVTAALRKSEQQVRLADWRRANLEKVEALATLSAGAAHELATPLSTISVIAAEIQREIDGDDASPLLVEDLQLIRSELNRCRQILDRMAGKAGEIANEGLSEVSAADLIEATLSEVRRRDRIQLLFEGRSDELLCTVPCQGLAQALRGLVQNALDATELGGDVCITVSASATHSLEIVLVDTGTGIPTDVLDRIGEPFFTTKPPGSGMGLGVYLAKNVIERIGGQLDLHSTWKQGTTVTVTIPFQGRLT